MATTREQAFEALRALMTQVTALTTQPSRIWKHWDIVPANEQPALFIVETPESFSQSKGSPALRTLNADLVLYVNRGAQPNVVMSSILNPILDEIEFAMRPSPFTGFNSLGGLVSHAWINRSDIYEGTFGDQSVVIVPVEILMNSDDTSPAKTYIFDSCSLFAYPVRKMGGGSASITTPVRMANLKGVRFEAESEIVIQGSQLEYPVAAARGVTRVRMSAQIGAFDGLVVDQVFFGRDHVTGATLADIDRLYLIPSVGPKTITVVPPSSGTFFDDLGVARSANGSAFAKTSGVPAPNEYSVSGNVYTFNDADAAAGVAISYLYTVTTGSKIVLANQFKGIAPLFRAVLQGGYNGRKVTWVLDACTTNRFAVPTLVEQFAIMDFEFEAIADSTGLLGTLSIG